MAILYCSANMRKNLKMADSQSPPKNQLKKRSRLSHSITFD